MTTFRTTRGSKLVVEAPEIYLEPAITPKDLKLITIFVDNQLGQAVTVQLKANCENSFSKAVNLGSAVSADIGRQEARSLSAETSGWLPYIMVQVYCSTAPTTGSLTIYRVRSKDDKVLLVDSLAIRDTALHNPSTDPDKILIKEW